MEKKVVSLLGGSFFLVIAGVVLYLWSPFNAGSGFEAGGVVPFLLLLVGALGLNISWVLHDVVERLTRVERSCEGRISSAQQGNAEPDSVLSRGLF
jgi:hypothetical protein